MQEQQPQHQQTGQYQPQQSRGSHYQPQQGTQSQQSVQGQPGMQSQQGGQGQGYQQIPSRELRQFAPDEIQRVIVDLDEFETIAEWAHTRSMEQGQHQVASVAHHLAEIAHLEKRLVLGRSPFAGTVSQCTAQSFQQGVQQLQQHAQDPTIQEVVEYAQYVTQSLGQADQQLQQWGQMQQGGQTQQTGQTGGMQSGGQQFAGSQGGFQGQQY